MPFNINDFTSNLNNTKGPAFQHTYKALVTIPQKLLQRVGTDVQKHLSFRIDTIDLPGRTIAEMVYRDYGLVRNFGGPSNMINITMTMIVSSDFREREIFLAWQDLITGNYRTNPQTPDGIKRRFNVGYYDDYVGTVDILQYELNATNDADWIQKTTLRQCWPTVVQAMNNTWNDTEIQRMSVVFNFYDFIEEYRNDINILPTIEPIDSILNSVSDQTLTRDRVARAPRPDFF